MTVQIVNVGQEGAVEGVVKQVGGQFSFRWTFRDICAACSQEQGGGHGPDRAGTPLFVVNMKNTCTIADVDPLRRLHL